MMENARDALHDFTAAVEANPRNHSALNNRALALRRLGLVEAALDDFSSSLEIRPEQPDIHFLIGQTYFELGDPAKSRAAIRRALSQESESPRRDGTQRAFGFGRVARARYSVRVRADSRTNTFLYVGDVAPRVHSGSSWTFWKPRARRSIGTHPRRSGHPSFVENVVRPPDMSRDDREGDQADRTRTVMGTADGSTCASRARQLLGATRYALQCMHFEPRGQAQDANSPGPRQSRISAQWIVFSEKRRTRTRNIRSWR